MPVTPDICRILTAVGYGILASLGAPVVGIDVPTVSGHVQHILIGVAVACLTYAKTPKPEIPN